MKTKLFLCAFLMLAGISKLYAEDISNISRDKTLQGNKQLLFIENKGQVMDLNGNRRPDILYTVQGQGVKIFICKTGIDYQFTKSEINSTSSKIRSNILSFKTDTSDITTLYRLEMHLLGANNSANYKAELENTYYENFYNLVSKSDGIVKVKSYERIRIKNIYNKIDWILYFKEGKLEYDFVVNPGGNINDIKIKYDGATELKKNVNGSINISTPLGSITEHTPYSYQIINNAKIIVPSSFIIKRSNTIGFLTSEFESTKELILDPGIQWATYYGDSLQETGSAISVDGTGNVYLAGSTNSTSNISSGGFQNTLSGIRDAFIVKFNSLGNRIWATYYGGPGSDYSNSNNNSNNGICVDTSGNIYLTGTTYSNTNISSGGFQNTIGGNSDAFLLKLNSSGLRNWSTYYGGLGSEDGLGVAVDYKENVYITGITNSNSNISSGGFQNNYGGHYDAFLVKFNSTGTLSWATYYGDTAYDYGWDISTDYNGNVFLAGNTNSATNIASGGYQNVYSDSSDAFIVKFDSLGSRQWATYYGGLGTEFQSCVTTDNSGNVFLAGQTTSTSSISTGAGFQNSYGGGYCDAFLVKFNTNGVCIWGTYYGGLDSDSGNGVESDNNGNIYLVGATGSHSNISYGGFQNNYTNSWDVFIVKFNSLGSRLWGSYFGGISSDVGTTVCQDNNGNVYFGGWTSSNSNIAHGGYQNNPGGGVDAFLVKINSNCFPVFPLVHNTNICFGQSITIGTHTYNTTGTYNDIFPAANGCDSIITTNLTVNPLPNAIASPLSQTICSGSSITSIVFSGAVSGTTYNWSRNNTASITGIAATGSGNISGALTNTTNSPATVTFTITPTAAGCTGTPITTTVLVNQAPNAIASPLSQTICSGSSITSIVFSGAVSGTTYNWSRNNTASITGIAATGSGNISGALTNTTNAPATVTFTITPTAAGCTGTPITATVNIEPTLNITVNSPTICNGETALLIASGASLYSWSVGATSTGINTASATPVTTTTYTVTGTSSVCSSSSLATVTVLSNDTTTSIIGNTISSNDSSATTYQWLDCVRWPNIVISGSTNSNYTITKSGLYRVIVCHGNCCDTSNCEMVTLTSASILSNKSGIKIFPNPFTKQTTIKFDNLYNNVSIAMYNLVGQQLLETVFTGDEYIIERNSLAQGIYVLKIKFNGKLILIDRLVIE